MGIIVQKFGGSSVKDNESLNKVTEHIIREYENGKDVVVVVSAQGKTTNALIEQEMELSLKAPAREHDVLISTGEQITIAKLAILLQSKGIDAISFTGWQLPIKTDDNFINANIIDIDTRKIEEEIRKRRVVVVAGFQGINSKNEITTLGRGGSDTTAVYLAAVLGAEICEVYTDVNGVYEKDPNSFKEARKIENISYDEMLEMATQGAKVLHSKCVEVAKRFNVIIDVKSTFENGTTGTIVS